MALKHVLITGCSEGGIGSATALAFQRLGTYHVFATARSLAKMRDLATLPNVTCLELDVTSPSSVSATRKKVAERTGGKLDVLLNNAGMLVMAPALDTDVDKARSVFDVNFWGVVSVTNAFVKMVIAARGVVATTGSIAGDINGPFQSFYAASKAAIMIYSETLRLELAPFGVRVLTMATGVVSSNLASGLSDVVSLPADSLYKPVEGALKARLKGGGYAKMDPHDYAGKFVRLVEAGASGKVYLGNSAGVVKWAKVLLPAWIIVSVTAFLFSSTP
ncbi:uncharacterized protein A1O5_11771 [Cladophialophora psammophila CBS 110553]|uniref:Oxidoreductase n=1 Tax=Cladophialophora psammophila CBS 110553 TaxID=1182543 RepID=W9W8Z6_9EURO|nr:uncharacterized protein A1O5_11771 [Cladophialophora psammophila CBS 110553]EXJ61455.1 hypothetical protein A1O5_11771 [Cladophialophora psammophila CBS 110553]